MLTLTQVSDLVGKTPKTLRRWFKNSEFERFTVIVGRRKQYKDTVVDFLKTYKPEHKKRSPEKQKRKEYKERDGSSICWHCKTNPGECMWLRFHVPVKGWKATAAQNKEKTNLKSYIVLECPCFRK